MAFNQLDSLTISLSMTKLNDKQLAALRSITNKKIGFSCQGKAGKFMDAWLVTEVVAKRLIKYRTEKNVGKTWSWPEVESSLKYFELAMPAHLSTKKIFAGDSGRCIDRTPHANSATHFSTVFRMKYCRK